MKGSEWTDRCVGKGILRGGLRRRIFLRKAPKCACYDEVNEVCEEVGLDQRTRRALQPVQLPRGGGCSHRRSDHDVDSLGSKGCYQWFRRLGVGHHHIDRFEVGKEEGRPALNFMWSRQKITFAAPAIIAR